MQIPQPKRPIPQDLHFAYCQAAIGAMAVSRGDDIPKLSLHRDDCLVDMIADMPEEARPLYWSVADIAGSKAFIPFDANDGMLERTIRDMRRSADQRDVVDQAIAFVDRHWHIIDLIGSRLMGFDEVSESATRSLLLASGVRLA